MSVITSTQNPLIKEVVALRDAKARRRRALTIIDGEREILRAKAAGIKLESIFWSSASKINLKPFAGIISHELSAKVFEKIAYGDRADGILAIAKTPQHRLADLKLSKNPFLVVVESLEKPGNLGAILRTADGAAVDGVIVCDAKTDLYNPNVIRSSTGVIFKVPVVLASVDETIGFLKKNHIKSLGLFPDAKETYTRLKLNGPLAIVLGREDQGLSSFWQKQCDFKASIPMKGIADSLNVSVSAAIVIYESLRQRSN